MSRTLRSSFRRFQLALKILESFFTEHHILPAWTNCNLTWGRFDRELGKWTGAVGEVGHTPEYYCV